MWRRPPGELEELGPDLRYFVSVIADGGPLLMPLLPSRRLYTGDAVNPTVALRYRDQTAPHADVELSVEVPDGSLGDLVMQHGLTEPDPSAEPIDSFRATLQQLAAEAGGELPLARSTRTLELFDDAAHDDGAMESDGIYANPVDDLLRFEARTPSMRSQPTERPVVAGGRRCGPERRPGDRPGRSDVRLVDSTIRFTPRDRYGNPLGPGRSGGFTVTPRAGSQVTGLVSDNGDGSYEVPVTWEGAGPSVAITQPDPPSVSIAPTPPGEALGMRCPRWLCWLLGLLALSAAHRPDHRAFDVSRASVATAQIENLSGCRSARASRTCPEKAAGASADLRRELRVGTRDVLPTAPPLDRERKAFFSALCAASWKPCCRKALGRRKLPSDTGLVPAFPSVDGIASIWHPPAPDEEERTIGWAACFC